MMNKILKQKNPVFKKLLFNLIKNSKHKFILKKDVILKSKFDFVLNHVKQHIIED